MNDVITSNEQLRAALARAIEALSFKKPIARYAVAQELKALLAQPKERPSSGYVRCPHGHNAYTCHHVECRELIATVETVDDSARLEWVMRNVTGAEWRRLGVSYGDGMSRRALDLAAGFPLKTNCRGDADAS